MSWMLAQKVAPVNRFMQSLKRSMNGRASFPQTATRLTWPTNCFVELVNVLVLRRLAANAPDLRDVLVDGEHVTMEIGDDLSVRLHALGQMMIVIRRVGDQSC